MGEVRRAYPCIFEPLSSRLAPTLNPSGGKDFIRLLGNNAALLGSAMVWVVDA